MHVQTVIRFPHEPIRGAKARRQKSAREVQAADADRRDDLEGPRVVPNSIDEQRREGTDDPAVGDQRADA